MNILSHASLSVATMSFILYMRDTSILSLQLLFKVLSQIMCNIIKSDEFLGNTILFIHLLVRIIIEHV